MADTGPFPALVAAVQQYKGDRYSQAQRWQPGFSDCSSFVGKGMKALGLNPGGSTTLTYMASSDWYTVSRSQVGPGDIAVNSAHMIIVTGPDTGIGQENTRRNVQEGTIDDLMSGTGPYVFKRYSGGSNITFAGYNTGVTPAGVTSIPAGLTKAVEWMGNTTNWLRVGMVLGGGILIWMTVVGIGKSQLGGLLGNGVKTAGKNVGSKVAESVKKSVKGGGTDGGSKA